MSWSCISGKYQQSGINQNNSPDVGGPVSHSPPCAFPHFQGPRFLGFPSAVPNLSLVLCCGVVLRAVVDPPSSPLTPAAPKYVGFADSAVDRIVPSMEWVDQFVADSDEQG